jgi:hypothetical protein
VRFVKLFASAGHEKAKPRQSFTKLGRYKYNTDPGFGIPPTFYDAARATVR